MRARNPALERELIDLAARAASLPGDGGLHAFADHRALPGGVRTGIDWDREAAEEIADCANYLLWACIEVYDGYLAGDPDATRKFERRMRALMRQVQSWTELFTDAA